MRTTRSDGPADGESAVADRPGTESTPAADEECAACGDPESTHRLLLTVDWVDYLVEVHGTHRPEGECTVPLCSRCRSRAELLEIAEMNLDGHAREERATIVAERNRFLESLRVELISNFSVSETVSVYE